MKKQIVSETKQYAPSFPDELLLDDTPKVNSFNGVTSDGVARAIAGSGDVPAPGEGDDGKVLTVVDGAAAWAESQGGSSYTAGDGIDITNNEISADVDGTTIGIDASTKKIKLLSSIPTVDQTYSAVSNNAQSGVAVAQAIAAIPSASYTAGDGIAITNDEIKVRVKNDSENPLKVTAEQGGGGYASIVTPEGTPSSEGWKALDPYYLTIEYDEQRGKTHIGFRYLWNRNDPNPLGMVSMSEDSTKHFNAKLYLLTIFRKESYTDLIATSDTLVDAFTAGWDASHSLYTYSLGSLVETTDDGDVFSVEFDVFGDQTGAFNAIAFASRGSDYSGILETVQSSFLSESHVLALQGDGVYIVGDTIPGGDLYVEVDQTFNSWSAKPQSGYAVNDAINSVRQVPTGSWDDTGKALVYDDAESSARWADQSSASISRDGTALEVRLRNASGVNNSGLAVNTTETPTIITGVVASGGPNSSYYATFTKAVALDPYADTINITGFEASIPSGALGPIYAIVVDGSTWQSGTLTGGIVFDRETDDGLNLADPGPRKASVITDPNDQWADSTFFGNVNTFMVFGVSNDNLLYDYWSGNFYGPFIDEWKYNGLYSALDQYAVAMTQPSGDVEFEILSRPVETRGLYVSNPVPAYASGDAGKVLAVNTGATGVEWVNAAGALYLNYSSISLSTRADALALAEQIQGAIDANKAVVLKYTDPYDNTFYLPLTKFNLDPTVGSENGAIQFMCGTNVLTEPTGTHLYSYLLNVTITTSGFTNSGISYFYGDVSAPAPIPG